MGAASGLTSGSRGRTPDGPAKPSGARCSSAAPAGSRMGGASGAAGAAGASAAGGAAGASEGGGGATGASTVGVGAGAGGAGSAAAAAANNGQISAAQSHRPTIRVPGMVRPSCPCPSHGNDRILFGNCDERIQMRTPARRKCGGTCGAERGAIPHGAPLFFRSASISADDSAVRERGARFSGCSVRAQPAAAGRTVTKSVNLPNRGQNPGRLCRL